MGKKEKKEDVLKLRALGRRTSKDEFDLVNHAGSRAYPKTALYLWTHLLKISLCSWRYGVGIRLYTTEKGRLCTFVEESMNG
jgi:hypothetical protein